MTPFEELRVSCGFTDTDIVESECIFRSWSACWREASSTSKSPESQPDQVVSIPAELIHRGQTVHHPSNGSPRTANTWVYLAVHEKQEANRAASASHGELPPGKEEKEEIQKGGKNSKGDQILGYLGVVTP
ncbi:hypothetical protein AVEN_203705-1 [Araneus ventricosus]|uniref:Uncharacterized protein n=1 Tax=Araneus ventricosus TaxID=182803 RepID=A0A4Y2EZF7_ARAVE|nr:hypothetical protein AVEN_203705-1 [Araneus ventricosus]